MKAFTMFTTDVLGQMRPQRVARNRERDWERICAEVEAAYASRNPHKRGKAV